MAREATKIELYGDNNDGGNRRFTVASNAAIVKGTFLKFAGPRTASASAGTGDFFAGIASMEKVNNDYSTSISAWTNGIFECTASGAITAGDLLKSAAPGNYVITCTTNATSQAVVIGYALETAAADETLAVRINV